MTAFAEDRLPPQSLEAERGLLGSILLDADRLDDVADVVGPSDLYRDAHAAVYRHMLRLRDAGRPTDSIALEEAMRAAGEWDRLGGMELIEELIGSAPHSVNARYYAQIVRQKAIGREVIAAAELALRDAYRQQMTAEDLVSAVQARALALGERGAGDGPKGIDEGLTAVREQIAARAAGEVRGVPTGLIDLDAMLGGCLGENQMIVVGARPSHGKTLLGLQCAGHAAIDLGVPALYFTLEMSQADLLERLTSARSGVFYHRLRDPAGIVDPRNTLTDRDYAAIDRAHAAMAGKPLHIDETTPLTAARALTIARRQRLRGGVGLVVIDYLQLLEGVGDGDDSESRQLSVAGMSRRFKELARELKAPVLVLSQLNRKSESRDNKRPALADLRESGAIEQDADVVILLHRPEKHDKGDRPGVVEAIVAKNRNGRCGTVELAFDGKLQTISDLIPDIPPAGAGDEPF